MSFDNILSETQVMALRDALKTSPETAYKNVGIRLGTDIVEIFNPENYANLLNNLIRSSEYNSDIGTAPRVRAAWTSALANMDANGASIDTRVGKLCSTYTLMWTQKLTPNWFFYYVPQELHNKRYTYYSLAPPQQIQSQRSSQQGGRGRGNNEGRGSQGGRGGRGNNDRFDQSQNVNGRGDRFDRRSQRIQQVTSNEPRKPIFSGIASRINSTEAMVASMVPPPVLRNYNIESYTIKSNELLESIRAKFELDPYLCINCNRQTGVLSLQKISEDEDFDTHGYQYCPFHSGSSLTGLDPVSEELRYKTTGAYGFMTHDGKAFDCCYLSGSIDHTDEESTQIDEIRSSINGILGNIEDNIVNFNNLRVTHAELLREQFLAKQLLNVANTDYINNLGDNPDRNVQLLQTIMMNPLFQKTTVRERLGRSVSITDSFISLPIMSHTILSSFFDNEKELISVLDKVGLKMKIDDINIAIPQAILVQISSLIPDVRDKIVRETVNLNVQGSDLVMKFNKYPISMKLSQSEIDNILRYYDIKSLAKFESNYADVTLTPHYTPGSYRSAIFNLGRLFAESFGFYENVMDKYDVISYIGACYISQHSDILSSFVAMDNDLMFTSPNQTNDDGKKIKVMREFPYSIIKSKVNRYSMTFEEIEPTIQSLSDQIDIKNENGTVKFTLGGKYPLEISKSDAVIILHNLKSMPKFYYTTVLGEDKLVIKIGVNEIPIEDVESFFKKMLTAVNSLSDRAKKENNSATFVGGGVSVEQSITKDSKWISVKDLEDEDFVNKDKYNTKCFNEKFKFANQNISAIDALATIDSYEEEISNKLILPLSLVKIGRFNIAAERVPGFFNELRNFVKQVSDKGSKLEKEEEKTKSKVKSGYDTKYFNEKFVVDDIVYSGYDGMKILDDHVILRSMDLSNGTIDVDISSIPITDYNIEYLTQVLFDEDTASELISVMSNSNSRKYIITMILFGSDVSTITINGKFINLKDDLNAISPFKPTRRIPFAISQKEAKKGLLLKKYMQYMEDIDRISIRGYEEAVQMFGQDMIKSIFTGMQTKINGILTPLDYENKEVVIDAAGDIYNSRVELKSFLTTTLKVFLDKVHTNDSVEKELPSFYTNVGEYTLYSRDNKHTGEFDLVIPTNPYVSNAGLKKNASVYETDEGTFYGTYDSIYPTSFSSYVSDNEKVKPIFTREADYDVAIVMKLLFPSERNISVSSVFLRYIDILTNTKYQVELSILDLIDKYKDLTKFFSVHMSKEQLVKLHNKYVYANKVFNYIVSGNLKQKADDGMPTLATLEPTVLNLINEIKEIFDTKKIPADDEETSDDEEVLDDGDNKYVIDGKKVIMNPGSTFVNFLATFEGSLLSFNDRRKQMRTYVKELISNLYDIRYDRGSRVKILKYEDFINEGIYYNNGNRLEKDINKIDIIELAINNVSSLVDSMDENPVDPTYKNSVTTALASKNNDGTEIRTLFLTLNERLKIYNKFAKMIKVTTNKVEYETLIKGICYYLVSNLDRRYYDIYLVKSYTAVLNEINANSLNKFLQIQDQFCSDLNNLQSIKDKKTNISVKLSTITGNLNKTADLIDSEKSKLTTAFVEFVSVIDVIAKTYEVKKKSYGDKDSAFKEVIENIKIRLESIKRNFNKVNDIDMKITMSLYDENMDIYNLRKGLSKDLNLGEDAFYSVVESSIVYIKLYSKLPANEQFDILNEKLSIYNLSVTSTVSSVNNVVRTRPLTEQETIKKEYSKCKFTWQMLELMREEEDNIRNKLFTYKVEPIKVPKRDDQTKPLNYGDELNLGIERQAIDSFTHQETNIVGKNMTLLLDRISSALRVVDCGPGLHFLSDTIETFIDLVMKIDTKAQGEAFMAFRSSMKKFMDFNSAIGKDINEIILNSEFRAFVSVINGKLDEFNTIKESINFYNSTPNIFTVYDGVTPEFVRGMLVTFSEIYKNTGVMDMESLLEKISVNCEKKFTDDDVTSLIETLNDFNSACINFLDEYHDQDGKILNDNQVLEYRNTHKFTTYSPFMVPLFKKLNKCMNLFIVEQGNNFKGKMIERFVSYVVLFSNKFRSIKKLEKYMLKR